MHIFHYRKLSQNLTWLPKIHITPGIFATLFLLLLVFSYVPAPAQTRFVSLSTPGLSLRALAQTRGTSIGAAVNLQALQSDPQYRETLAREFNMLTPEVSMKFAATEPNRNLYSFKDADTIVAFAKAH